MASVARITIAAWRRYAAHAQQQQGRTFEQPQWITELCQNFGSSPAAEAAATAPINTEIQEQEDVSHLAGIDFDLDMFDWSIWDQVNKNAAPLSTRR